MFIFCTWQRSVARGDFVATRTRFAELSNIFHHWRRRARCARRSRSSSALRWILNAQMVSARYHAQLSLYAGRIHEAIISSVNAVNKSVTVEWLEKGETKGKEIDVATLTAVNPGLADFPDSSPTREPKRNGESSKSYCVVGVVLCVVTLDSLFARLHHIEPPSTSIGARHTTATK